MEIDGLGQSLYFNAAQLAGQSAVKSNKSSDSQKTVKASKKKFASALEQSRAEYELVQDGFPAEIAAMEIEEAVVFLKDEADMAGDKLRESQLPENFAEYRKKVSRFLRYLAKNNYEVKKRQRPGFTKKGKPLNPQTQVFVINQKLDDLAKWMLSSHRDTLHMLAKIDEIQGMLVDLMAC